MSTQYESIQGTYEIPNPRSFLSDYAPIELQITRFYGGVRRGVSIQLTLNREYIQLDNTSAKELIKTLTEALIEFE